MSHPGLAHAWVMSLGLVTLACGHEPPPEAPLPDASEVELADTDAPLEGSLGGQPFRMVDARFRVVTFAGRERVDLLFADRAIERCGLPIARTENRLWIRVPGVTALSGGVLALLGDAAPDAQPPPLELHYERPVEGRYVESHRGVARVEIIRSTPELVEGRLRACFADASHSCVGGAFHATPCRSRIDGRALREPPGLDDEALEPLSPDGEPPT